MERTAHPQGQRKIAHDSLRFVALLALAVPSISACSSADVSHSEQDAGSLRAALTLPDGASIEAIEYSITGNGIAPLTGSVSVKDSSRATFRVGGIPAGQGYTISISTTTSDDQSCSGSAPFDIVASQTSSVSVAIQCGTGQTQGEVKVDASVSQCPLVVGLSASPTEVNVGSSIALSSATSPGTAGVIWSATAGQFGDPSAKSTSYTCDAAGDQTVTVTLQGAPSSCSASARTVVITCSEIELGSGGASGSGGGTAAGGETSSGGASAAGGASSGGTFSGGATSTGGESSSSGGTGGGSTPTQVTLQHMHRGAFNSPEIVQLLGQPWKVVGNSYQVRSIGDGAAPIQASRSYFSFDLSNVEGAITSAELRISHPSSSYDSPDSSETVELFDVGTSLDLLQNPNQSQGLALLASIFDDLGTGASFGSFVTALSDNGSIESIALNAAALGSLTSAASAGSTWSVGLSLTSGNVSNFGQFERVFRASDDTGGSPQPATELVLTIE